MPAGSKMDPLPAKAEPISDSGNASWITHLRSRKETAAGIEECHCVRETTLKTPRSVKKEQEEVFQVSEQRFP